MSDIIALGPEVGFGAVDEPAADLDALQSVAELLGEAGEAEEEEAPPDQPAAARVYRDDADRFFLELPQGGRIVYYAHRNEFYAECPLRVHGHGQLCRRARTSNANHRRPAQGRPLGTLMAWLELSLEYETGDDHKTIFACTLQQRRAAREALKLIPGSQTLLAAERDKFPGEDSEPEGEP